MRLAILDDWFDTLRGLDCFARLAGIDVTVFNDHLADIDALAARLQPFDGLVLFRERTAIPRALVAALPNLKLISQRSVYPISILTPVMTMVFWSVPICREARTLLLLPNIAGP